MSFISQIIQARRRPSPVFTPPPTVPTIDDEEVETAKRRALSLQQAKGGRSATILTGPSGGGPMLGSAAELGGV